MVKALQTVSSGYGNLLKHLGDVFEDYYELKKQRKYDRTCSCGILLPRDYRHDKCPWCLQNDLIEGRELLENNPGSHMYYIWSRKWTYDYNHIFWGPDSNGYTRNLNQAGIYSLEEIQKKNLPILTKDNINILKYRKGQDAFAIAVEDVELLGKKMLCVMN